MNPTLSFEESEDYLRLRDAWDEVRRDLERDLPAQWYETHVAHVKPLTLSEGIAYFSCQGRMSQTWLEQRMSQNIARQLSDALGEEVAFDVKAEINKVIEKPAPIALSANGDDDIFVPNPRLTFDTYVVGDSNRLAHSGAKSVAADAGGRFNPLFIYGPSGLGKTHLLHAIATELRREQPGIRIAYMSAQRFAEDFVHALQSSKIEAFRRSLRTVGIFLLDDIQMIAGRDKTLEEVFHTYNVLHSMAKQIVITSDRPPRELHLVDERLRSRFEAGLVADVKMPDTETRCAILMAKAKQDRLDLDFKVAMHLAEHVPGNIRVLEGALTRVMAEGSIQRSPLTTDLAAQVISQHYRPETMAKPQVDHIIQAVGKHFAISPEEIRGQSRKAPIVHARHIAVWLTRELTQDSWKHIGSQFGDRDHTSMMHGYQKISEQVIKDSDLKMTVQTLKRGISPEST